LWLPTVRPLELELGNLRAALRWAVEVGDAERAMRLSGDLWQFWYQRRYPAEGRAWLAELLAAPAAMARTVGRARALAAAAILACYQGDFDAARAMLDEALSIQRETGDRTGLVTSLIDAGWVESILRDWAAARAHLQEALPLARELGQPIPLHRCLYFLSYVAYGQGEYGLAAALQHEAIATVLPSSPSSVASSLNVLGHIATAQGDYAQARAYYADSVAHRWLVEPPVGMAHSLAGWANLAVAQGQYARAARLAGAAARLFDESGVLTSRAQETGIRERLEVAREAIGPDAYDASWAEGWAITLEQAVAYALGEDGR
jgi:tetratricopeptide (TPR) repeat protein